MKIIFKRRDSLFLYWISFLSRCNEQDYYSSFFGLEKTLFFLWVEKTLFFLWLEKPLFFLWLKKTLFFFWLGEDSFFFFDLACWRMALTEFYISSWMRLAHIIKDKDKESVQLKMIFGSYRKSLFISHYEPISCLNKCFIMNEIILYLNFNTCNNLNFKFKFFTPNFMDLNFKFNSNSSRQIP